MKGIIKSLIHDKGFLWYKLAPKLLTLQQLDKIYYALDEWHDETIPDRKSYTKCIPARFMAVSKGSTYAISIYSKEVVDFIVFKNHPSYEKVSMLMEKYFKFMKPKRVKKKKKS